MTANLNNLLKATSRSFYLTLRVLPASIRPQIGLAYLLARTTDTIADTEIIPVAQRLEALQRLRGRILTTNTLALNFSEIARQQGAPAEKTLLERAEDAIGILESLSAVDQKRIREVLDIITSGQVLDLQRFDGASSNNVIALKNVGELDDYTYRVAGCVGEFWTLMCRAHLFPNANIDDKRLIEQGIRFGKGLQLVNILRDIPRDLQQGRCYLPHDELRDIGLAPADLLNPAAEPKLRPLYNRYLDLANGHLRAGWDYTNALPGGCKRVRLGCAWPILIGAKTIERLWTGNVLDPKQRIKISRTEVRNIMLKSVLYYPFRTKWKNLLCSK